MKEAGKKLTQLAAADGGEGVPAAAAAASRAVPEPSFRSIPPPQMAELEAKVAELERAGDRTRQQTIQGLQGRISRAEGQLQELTGCAVEGGEELRGCCMKGGVLTCSFLYQAPALLPVQAHRQGPFRGRRRVCGEGIPRPRRLQGGG